MNKQLNLYVKPNAPFTFKKELESNNIELYTVETTLLEPNIDKLRGYKWDIMPFISVDRLAVANDKDLTLLNKLIEVITYGYGCKPIHTYIDNVPVIEKIICNGYPTVETYFEQLLLLKNGETNYWYLASYKDGIKVDIDEYEYALRKYTGDNAWHVSDITEHDKNHVVYEFTNTYDDLYY